MLDVPDLVAVGDYLIHRRLPLTDAGLLRRLLPAVPYRHGGAKLARALALISDAAESRPESLLRVLLAEAGLPAAEINHSMVDATTGRELRTDFRWSRHRVIVEYQGDYHREPRQWRADMRRRSQLEAMGWTVIEANWDDILDPGPLLGRLRRLLES